MKSIPANLKLTFADFDLTKVKANNKLYIGWLLIDVDYCLADVQTEGGTVWNLVTTNYGSF